MCENLRSILSQLDTHSNPRWTRDYVEHWQPGQLDHCLAAGLFVPDGYVSCAACRGCGEIVDVVVVTNKAQSKTEACLCCGECGPHRVPLPEVACWRLNFWLFLERLCAAIEATDVREELVRGRIWRLGKCHWAGASRCVYLGRGLQQRDCREPIRQARLSEGAVLLVPRAVPPAELEIPNLPTLIRLTDILSWQGTGFAFDSAAVISQLGAMRAAPAAARHSLRPQDFSKRASRLAVIEGLKRELVAHVRAARDHALTTRDRSGQPELLPRPTHGLLARQLKVSRSTVTRCMEDQAAGELRRLWELADDLHGLVR